MFASSTRLVHPINKVHPGLCRFIDQLKRLDNKATTPFMLLVLAKPLGNDVSHTGRLNADPVAGMKSR